jgi:hypothetical protein
MQNWGENETQIYNLPQINPTPDKLNLVTEITTNTQPIP